jgi:DNA-binding transcriptional LysR family regulator
LIVSLTPAGESYAEAVVSVIESLDAGLAENVERGELAAARKVLLTVMAADIGGS